MMFWLLYCLSILSDNKWDWRDDDDGDDDGEDDDDGGDSDGGGGDGDDIDDVWRQSYIGNIYIYKNINLDIDI